MKAYVLQNGTLQLKQMPEPQIGAEEVVVALRAVGLNRRDLYIRNRVGNEENPLILGSDGAGVVEVVGANVTDVSVGDEVIINPSLRWKNKSAAPPTSFDILGMPDHGTFAEKIVISADQVERKPDYLTWKEAAVVSLAALTAYRALFTQGNLKSGETVFIPGGTSGVATYLIQFALAAGAKVIVTSRSEEKRKLAQTWGANIVLSSDADFQSELANETVDLVVESVGAATFNRSLSTLKKGGTIVVFGATTDDVVDLDLRAFFYGQYKLIGSTMGSKEELQEALQLMEKHRIQPIIGQTYHFDEIATAFADLTSNKYVGKLSVELD